MDDTRIIRTLVCPDGVIGLNGSQYLLDDDGKEMEFNSKDSANSFLLDGGYSQEQFLEAWQHLVDTGLAWTLQGSFGRSEHYLIQEGYING